MHIQHLHLSHFRNHIDTVLDSGGRSVVLIGHNGAGKTNILEAISLLSPGRGLRQARLGQITHHHAPEGTGWVVHAAVEGVRGAVGVGTALDMQARTDRRLVKVEGEKLSSQSELTSHLAIIWQTPQMDGLFLQSASHRRSFFDRLVYGFDGEHARRVSAYEQAMRERNKLLEQGIREDEWLQSLEWQMAEQAMAIAVARNQLLARLKGAMDQATGHFPYAALTLDGALEQGLQQGALASDAEHAYREMLCDRRVVDRSAGRTTRGVHRTDLQVYFGAATGMDAASCSTGEQKALLLAILLAHARARYQWLGAPPILLLDEVVAHLDTARRKALFAEIEALGAQAFMTGTDAADFQGIEPFSTRFEVAGGTLIPCNEEMGVKCLVENL